MELVKDKLNKMKSDHEEYEDRLSRFNSELIDSRRNLEAANHEKEALLRRIEVVESHIINANKQREELLEQLRSLERNTDENEGRRRFLQDKELDDEQSLSKIEERLDEIRYKYDENSTKCEDAERRLRVLKTEYEKVRSKRLDLEEQAVYLQRQVDDQTLMLRDLEQSEMKNSARDYRNEDHMKLVEDYYREACEKEDQGRLRCQKLQRLIDQIEDQIELIQRRKKTTQGELQEALRYVTDS